jgi:hypothetical protein
MGRVGPDVVYRCVVVVLRYAVGCGSYVIVQTRT